MVAFCAQMTQSTHQNMCHRIKHRIFEVIFSRGRS